VGKHGETCVKTLFICLNHQFRIIYSVLGLNHSTKRRLLVDNYSMHCGAIVSKIEVDSGVVFVLSVRLKFDNLWMAI